MGGTKFLKRFPKKKKLVIPRKKASKKRNSVIEVTKNK